MAWSVNWKVAKWTQVGRKNQWRTHSFVRSCVICSQLVRWNLGHFETFRFWPYPKFQISALPCKKSSYQFRYHFKDNKTVYLMTSSTCRFFLKWVSNIWLNSDFQTVLRIIKLQSFCNFLILTLFHISMYCTSMSEIIVKSMVSF